MTERNPEPPGTGPDGHGTGSPDPLSDLKARLLRARGRGREHGAERGRGVEMSGAGVALRAGIEMVGTLAVGVGIGWALDLWLGTGPWLLVVFFFVGAAAGMLNVYRAMSGMGAGAGSRGGSGDDKDGDSGGAGRRPGPPPAE